MEKNPSGYSEQLGVGFSLGGEQAEADPLLQQAFFESGHYSAIDSKNDPRCFIVGRTGSGKSALLQRIPGSGPPSRKGVAVLGHTTDAHQPQRDRVEVFELGRLHRTRRTP